MPIVEGARDLSIEAVMYRSFSVREIDVNRA
jgi:hypothetical protein